jgi:hypothetical protein
VLACAGEAATRDQAWLHEGRIASAGIIITQGIIRDLTWSIY